jgi:glycosyltransferase involved in cell wall biosynthesis
MTRILIVWGLWGPYHCRRFEALRQLGADSGYEVVGLSLFQGSSVNRWSANNLPEGVEHVDLGPDEAKLPLGRIGRLFAQVRRLKPDVTLVPSYWHWSLVLSLASRLANARLVMMNETHAGTARDRTVSVFAKRILVRRFDAALVGGKPHRRYFASLGMSSGEIFTGYDAVDNDYYRARAEEIRGAAGQVRSRYGLPEHYLLSVGRFVAKKNLGVLIEAYRRFLDLSPDSKTHLVLVGSGEEEGKLRALCATLQLPAYDKTQFKGEPPTSVRAAADGAAPISPGANDHPGVHFYGFRQIDETPVFYALADGFVLPSLREEWGLVVNEAMASGLAVVVSERAGCAEDLLEKGRAPVLGSLAMNLSVKEPPLPKGRRGSPEVCAHLGHVLLHIRKNGFVFNPESPKELAYTLFVLDSQTALREAMAKESGRIVEKFSCANFAKNALAAAHAALGLNPGCASPERRGSCERLPSPSIDILPT